REEALRRRVGRPSRRRRLARAARAVGPLARARAGARPLRRRDRGGRRGGAVVGGKGEAESIQGGGERSGLLRHGEALQRDLDKALAELAREVVEAHDAARNVTVKLGGDGSVQKVELAVAGLDPRQKSALEESLSVALGLAIERMFELRRKRAATVT